MRILWQLISDYMIQAEVITICDLLCLATAGIAASHQAISVSQQPWHDQAAKETLTIVQSVVCKAKVTKPWPVLIGLCRMSCLQP